MSRYLYATLKDDIPVTTFKCAGCGKRFPDSRLFFRGVAIDLRRGKPVDERGRFYSMVCSWACSKKTVKKTLIDFYTFNEVQSC